MKPIYIPSGKAKEYGDYAINIYTGCPHRCHYCFAPSVLHKNKEDFHGVVEPRKCIVDEVKKQLRTMGTGYLIHLCFTCDPYPVNIDTTATRLIIKAIKDSGNNVQILTKGGIAIRDFDLLDENDWFGVTYAGYEDYWNAPKEEPFAASPNRRLQLLSYAKRVRGLRTWVSCEPVLNVNEIYMLIKEASYIDRFKIGKLNYHPSDINWHDFGIEAERLCKEYGRDYYIKESLRQEMEKTV